ncbi:putative beta-hydroxydecanoyl-ACP dehydrase [Pectobacterium atrosepticum SCRI1043]|uniref:Beta-hydroxydecanoyl-ACP dehydrase n=1 Tax=Pectobacterium atrosepticum (strain SCRI 1043 / ATCC BAA-672) TaxID=218491 RepID=Q6CYL4_PECAS|nr:hotdog family protein [Pectobacterium atrosepticum]GKV87933.1 dehydratase [Pectobacterium carotovorum subsp. carotovorum]ATY92910.1 3-hydroxy-fatty acyl-ACP dehydratase [Pectobacterium atrosepticum]KFX17476.1 3-hydroxy-fatty acyl-ACP dehydratase [Pectobacterium atrosepticum]KFX22898.1 3-hydroxy-fatty acyl-ACP dehydratase [Pectobacterium atrosepticum]KMK82175.1 putative beta-hydroxydecanoyl-ACP dehydrase [Pectobacterium atrosepticum ICMP 1526]
MSEYLAAADYLPHSAPMVLVDEVIHVDDEHAHCRVAVSREGILAPFLNAQGHLPAWFGIEIIAQTIGVWSGWHGRQSLGLQEKPRPGMLLGGRGYHCQQAIFPAGSLLDVTVMLVMRDEKIGSFEGEIAIDGEKYASGRLNTYQPDDRELNILLEQGKPL